MAASNEGAVFLIDTEHRVKGAHRPQHVPRAPLALISERCTGVIGGARDVNEVDMLQGWEGHCVTHLGSRTPLHPLLGTSIFCSTWSESRLS